MKKYLSTSNRWLSAFGILLEVSSFLGWILVSGPFMQSSDESTKDTLFIAVLSLVTFAAMILTYQAWECRRMQRGVIISSSIWTDPIPGIVFVYVATAPALLSFVFSGLSIWMTVLVATQILAWLFWTQHTKKIVQDTVCGFPSDF
ncbi:MAG: hypothetical protein K9M10_03255 [Candidatus Pacebacteria bacterium]|nr:hypothetical protein [Candidatus Paceibacterota bacterium]MCF7857472.1 hypothetical protein [Candidatus Paceibacterota bacterium]